MKFYTRPASIYLTLLYALFISYPACATPPELTLANVYQRGMSLDGYWVSEKYDGVRAFWDGERFLSRGGHEYRAPAWFKAALPEQPLDGELWMGRGRFSELSGAVRKANPVDSEWREIRFMVFDLPLKGVKFNARLAALKQLFTHIDSPMIRLVEQQRATTHEVLTARLSSMVAAGGEGLMLRRGQSVYKTGRSDDLLKVKIHQDAEAKVIGYVPGNGKYQGLVGSLRVELENGRQFRIGTGLSDEDRTLPPPVGSVITFRFRGYTVTGLPRFASFLRVREDEPQY